MEEKREERYTLHSPSGKLECGAHVSVRVLCSFTLFLRQCVEIKGVQSVCEGERKKYDVCHIESSTSKRNSKKQRIVLVLLFVLLSIDDPFLGGNHLRAREEGAAPRNEKKHQTPRETKQKQGEVFDEDQ